MGTLRSLLTSTAAVFATLSTFGSVQAFAFPPKIEVQSATPTGALPKDVTISPDGKLLYITHYGVADHNNVSVIDASTLAPLRTFDLPGVVMENALSPDGKTLYVSNLKRNSVQIVDTETGKLTREVKAGMHPKSLLVSRDGKQVFAANWDSESVSVLDAKTGEAVRTLKVEKNPHGMAMTKGGKLYVASSWGKSVDVFEGPDFSKHRHLKDVCVSPRSMALAPDESKIFVTCLGPNEVVALDLKTETVAQRVKVGRAPKALDVSADGRYIVTADDKTSSTTLIDTHDWSTRTLEIPSMDGASSVVIARGGSFPAKAIEAKPIELEPKEPNEAKTEPHHGEPKAKAPGTIRAHAKPQMDKSNEKAADKSDKSTEKLEKKRTPLRFFVTGWYDNHVYAVGVAGTGPKYEVDHETAALTLKHRRQHGQHQ